MIKSLKELFWGLMGFHLLDEETELYSQPTNIRKLIGLLLNLYFLLPILVAIPAAIFAFIICIYESAWGIAILVLPTAIFTMGIYSIPCWIIIDWDKNRVLVKTKQERLNKTP